MRYLNIILLFFFLNFSCKVVGQIIDSVQSSDNFTIYYETMGKGEPLYILSGGPGITPYSMRDVATELSKNYQTVLIHQRGTGLTILPINEQTIQIDKYCSDIQAVKNKLSHKKINLLGHSWGGMLSMNYAKNYPDDINKMILIGSGGYNLEFNNYFSDNIMSRLSEDDQNAVEMINKFYEKSSNLATNDSLSIAINNLMREAGNVGLKGYFFDKQKADQLMLKENDINMKVLMTMMTSLYTSGWNIKDDLSKLKLNTLIIQGRQDPIDLETARQINSAIKSSELIIIERCGHFPWIEKPEEFYDAVNMFMTKK